MDSDEKQVRLVIERWLAATSEADLEALLDLMAEDVVFLTPGRPPFGRDGFVEGFESWSKTQRIEAKSDVREIEVCGALATCWAHLSITATRLADGHESWREGHVLSVFRKSPDGRWRLWRDANMVP
jgi:uncharacterized protein (TIGR02246 family)